VILRVLNKGQKKEIYFWNKAKIFFIFSAYTDACTSSCKIVVASKRPLIMIPNNFAALLSLACKQACDAHTCSADSTV